MNTAEIKYGFDLSLKAIEPIRYALFDTAEISQLVTTSQLNLIKQLASKFDAAELVKKLGGSVIKHSVLVPSARNTSNLDNGQFVTYPNDVLAVVEEQAAFSTSELKVYVKVKPVTYDEYVINIKNPFKCPHSELVWRLDYSNKKHELITHGPLASSYQMRYLCIPPDVNLDGGIGLLIAEAFHDEVVDGAVKAAIDILRVKSQLMPAQAKPDNDNQ